MVFRVRVFPMGVSRKNRQPNRREKPRASRRKLAHTPHDALFHFTFGNVEHARPALANLLPSQVSRLVDFSTLALQNGHFVNTDLARSETDLLFSAQIAGKPGKIYVLFEHMSSPEHLMVLRMLRYLLDIWEDFVAANPGTKKLPVIIPLVLHHSPSGWTSPLRLEELLDIDEEGLKIVSDHVPRFGMVLHDISGVSDDELMNRAMTALVRITLLLLRHGQTAKDAREFCEHLGKYAGLVRAVFEAPNGSRAIAAVMRYIQSVTKQSIHEVRMAMQQNNLQLIDEDTYWDIRDPGWREDQAREEGLEQGRRAVLFMQLAARFGTLPSWVHERVDAAATDELDAMSVKILGAQTIADVVGTKESGKKAKPRQTKST